MGEPIRATNGTNLRGESNSPRPPGTPNATAPQHRSDDWHSSDAGLASKANQQAQRLRQRLTQLSAPGAAAPSQKTNATPPDKHFIKGKRFSNWDFSHGARTVYQGQKYVHPYEKTAIDAASNGTMGTPLIGNFGHDPVGTSGKEAAAASTAGWSADLGMSLFLSPMAAWSALRGGKLAAASHKSGKALKRQIADLNAKLDALPKEPGARATRDALLQQLANLEETLKLNKNRIGENIASATSGAALCGVEAITIGTKTVGLATHQTLVIGQAAASGPLAVVSAVGALGIAPIGVAATFLESIFAWRKTKKLARYQERGSAHIQELTSTLRKKGAVGIDPGQLKEYIVFLEHKDDVRSKYFKRAAQFSKLRIAFNSIYGATAAVKFGIAITGLIVGGVTLTNPVGWALTGIVIGGAVVATVGAFAFTFSRRMGRYEAYRRNDDPFIERDFQNHLDAFDAEADAAETIEKIPTSPPTRETHQTGTGSSALETPQSAPAPSQAHITQEEEQQPLLHDVQDTAVTTAPADRQPHQPTPAPLQETTSHARRAEEQRRPANSELETLLANVAPIAAPSSGDDNSDRDDDTNGASSTPFAPAAPVPKGGLSVRVAQHHSISIREKSHSGLIASLNAQHGKTSARTVGSMFRNLLARIHALNHAGQVLIGSFNKGSATWAYRNKWAAHSTRVTSEHLRRMIQSKAPEWINFMKANLTSELGTLEQKIRSVERLKAQGKLGDADHPLHAFHAKHRATHEKIAALIKRIERNPSDRFIEKQFLELTSNAGKVADLRTHGEVIDALARGIHSQFERRTRDLKGMLHHRAQEAGSLRARALEQPET